MSDLRVALIQKNLEWEQIEANLAGFDASIDGVEGDVDLIILPEMFSTGFSMNPTGLAESIEGKAVTWLRQKARDNGAVLTGSLMIEEQGRYFNRLVWATPDGDMATYDKRHLFRYAGEEKIYTAGGKIITLVCKGWRIRPFICYDLRFPIWTRNLNLDYDLAVFVANWPAKRSAHWRSLLIARAIENQSYVIGVNRVGTDGNGLDYDGCSMVVAPTGEIITEAVKEEAVLTATLQSDRLDGYRQAFPAWKDADTDLSAPPSE